MTASELPRHSPEAERFFERYRKSGDIFWHELPDLMRLVVWEAMLTARRDWAVRVLDAFAVNQPRVPFPRQLLTGVWVVYVRAREHYEGPTPDAARHEAALAVFPTLDRNAPNWPGECP